MLETAMLVHLVVLAAPGGCPKEYGQIRWDGLEHRFADGGRQWRLGLSVWDRNTDSRPSDGDVVRISTAQVDGRDAGMDEAWFVLGGGLSRAVAARLKKAGDGVTGTCESRFEAQGLPKLGSNRELGRFLAGLTGAGAGPKVSREDAVRGQMAGWADELCRGKKHQGKEDLARRLLARAVESRAGLPKAQLRGMAEQVAADKALECVRLEGSNFTFP